MAIKFTQGEFDVACAAAREEADRTGYGGFVSNAKIASYVDKLFDAIERHRRENPGETGERKDQ